MGMKGWGEVKSVTMMTAGVILSVAEGKVDENIISF